MRKPALNRREFLRTTAACGTTMALGGFSVASQASAVPHRTSLVDAMRWAQLTLVEDDPGKFDPKFWLDYFRKIRADAACLSAGGCVAYYPTSIQFHHRSQWLKDGDPFGDLVASCRRLGMAVLARTDPHATYDDVQAARPDWIAVDADGKPRRHPASPEMWATCGFGPYNFEFMTAVHREIATRYDIDGIFINRWDGSGTCYCEHCRGNFKSATGFDLPAPVDPLKPDGRAYLLWRQQRLFELWQLWETEVGKARPGTCVIPNTAGGAGGWLDLKRVGEKTPFLVADRQGRHGVAAPWLDGSSAKEYRAVLAGKPLAGLFGLGPSESYRWMDSVQSPAEIRIWAAEGVANGMRPWFCKFSGTLRDSRWLKPVEEIFQRCAQWEPYLRNQASLARVGVVYSQQTAWFSPATRWRDDVENAAFGWHQALVEARIPFELVHDQLLDPDHLGAFKTLILPNLTCLSDAQCAQLAAFVEQGGGLVATRETSLCNEFGEARKDFGLANLFGVSFRNRAAGPAHNSYLQLDHSAPEAGILLAGLEDAPRIINGLWRIDVAGGDANYRPPLSLISSYPDLPMEKVYPRTTEAGPPQIFLRRHGRGRVVYFPWDIDRVFWEILAPDHGRLLANSVQWAMNEPQPVTVLGPGLLDVTVWRQSGSLAVHLVNLTNPMAMKGPYRELIPVGRQVARISLPIGTAPRRVRLLAAGQTVSFNRTNHQVMVTVPSILDHEIVAVDLA